MVSSTLGCSTMIGWKRRSRAASFSMCLRYSSSVVAPMQRSSPARQRRLEHVAGVHRALGGARADQRVQLVDEQDDPAVGAGHLGEDRLEAVLELAAVLGAGDHRAEVERHDSAVAQPLGHVAGGDALREPLGDGRLAHAGLADQHRVVLGPPAQHLDDPADLLVATDDGVELARRARRR